jgi:ComF family protein
VAVFAHHDGLAKELIHSAKYERAKAGLTEVAEMLATLLPFFEDDVVLTHVPTASSRIRERGYDQAEVIARRLAQKSRLPYSPLLARLGQAHQVGSGRRERIAHTRNAFRPIHMGRIKGAHIILIDDVCTTGASLESAARALKRAGAKRVDAIVFAQPD